MTEPQNWKGVSAQEFMELLHEIVQQTSFHAGQSGVFRASQLRRLYHGGMTLDSLNASSANPQVRDDLLAELTQLLSSLVAEFTIDGHIGYGLTMLMGGSEQLTVAKFAQIVIRAAALLGPERITRLVFGWAEGEPLRYRTNAVLCGISADQPLKLGEGIHFIGLPKSSAELRAHLPSDSGMHYGSMSLLSGVKVLIDCEATPALYKPRETRASLEQRWSYGRLRPSSLDTLCETLSLSCNWYISWNVRWFEYEDLMPFNTGVFPGSVLKWTPSSGQR